MSMVGIAATNAISAPDKPLDTIQSAQVQTALSPIVIPIIQDPNTTPEDIVQWLLNTLGGLLTTLIMYFLHKWLPDIFPKSFVKYYKRSKDATASNSKASNYKSPKI